MTENANLFPFPKMISTQQELSDTKYMSAWRESDFRLAVRAPLWVTGGRKITIDEAVSCVYK